MSSENIARIYFGLCIIGAGTVLFLLMDFIIWAIRHVRIV